jgi:signal transduction histidine kinase
VTTLPAIIISEIGPSLVRSLAATRALYLLAADRTGKIIFCNPTLATLLAVDADALVGAAIGEYLTETDAVLLVKRLEADSGAPDDEFLLNVVGPNQIPRTLLCRLCPFPEGFLLIGEALPDENRSLQEELLELNNQLSVLSRENTRKSRELAKALADLKQMQSLLVHQEKMTSLGLMTAGVAHEINNPIAFVLNNQHVLKRDFDDLLTFINTVGDLLPDLAAECPTRAEEIVRAARKIKLDSLAEAVPRKISANIDGLERIKVIVLNLRNFSRLDEAQQKYCDLAGGIQSTIQFLSPLLEQHGVTIETYFQPLQEFLCDPGALNQTVSAVITNAIQASSPGQIVAVFAGEVEDGVLIEVEDHGVGIPAEQLDHVFDPFFTTKPVGSGTGLGLSIAHQIVSTHQGTIKIESAPGIGTIVRIHLPRRL